jgi:Domain of unknown function (DUF4190)/GYF domain 2
MRILVNRGGQQLGPFSLAELRGALASGQVSQQDLAWWEEAPAWVPVSQIPGLDLSSPAIPNVPGAPAPTGDPASGLSITSLVLGILSFGLFCLTGIPAIICGHMALSRQKRAGWKSSGVAIGGLITGYLGTVLSLILPLILAITVPAFVRAREKQQLVISMTHAKQIVAACQVYQANHNNEFPPSLDALRESSPLSLDFTDPLAPEHGQDGYWYSKPARNAPGNAVVVASRGQSHDGRRALGHKDGGASIGPFTLPPER